MDDEELFHHLYDICLEMQYVWPTMRADINEAISKDREISQVHSQPKVLYLSKGTSMVPNTRTPYNYTGEVQRQERKGTESKRQWKFDPTMRKLSFVRPAPEGREKILDPQKTEPIRDSKVLLERI